MEQLKLDDAHFAVAELEQMLALAEQLDRSAAKLTLKERFTYAQAPVDTRNEDQVQQFLDWSARHAHIGRAGRLVLLDDGQTATAGSNVMEQALRTCTLWLWLDLRFPGVYGHVDEVVALRSELNDGIERQLKGKRPLAQRAAAPRGEGAAAPAGADRRRPDRRRAAPADERQGSDGLRRALRRRDPLRQGLQGSHAPQLPPGRGLHREPQGARTRARRARWPRARSSAARRRKPPGRAPRSTRCTGWPRPACACRSPYNFHDGVLLMELVADADGEAAPRLNDVDFTPEDARRHHATLLREVVRMLCAGVVHGDLSEFNILLAADGPVIIDLPQAVDAAGNNHAPRMLLRDVDNLRHFFGRFAPELLATAVRPRDLDLYERGLLQPDSAADRPLRAQHGAGGPGRGAARDRRRARRRGRTAAAARRRRVSAHTTGPKPPLSRVSFR